MVKYKSKPCIVDAVQWNGESNKRITISCEGCNVLTLFHCDEKTQCYRKYIFSYATHRFGPITKGDYILTHSDGRLSVMSAAEFESKYEKEVVWKDCAACSGWGKNVFGMDKCPTCHGTGKVEE